MQGQGQEAPREESPSDDDGDATCSPAGGNAGVPAAESGERSAAAASS